MLLAGRFYYVESGLWLDHADARWEHVANERDRVYDENKIIFIDDRPFMKDGSIAVIIEGNSCENIVGSFFKKKKIKKINVLNMISTIWVKN